MKLKIQLIFTTSLLILFVSLSGCASQVPLQRSQGDLLRAGDADDDLAKKIGKATAKLTHKFEFQSKTYEARHYNLQTGSTQQSSVVCTPICFPVFYTVPVLTPYVVILEGTPLKLVASGTIEELSRSPDTSISDLMPTLKDSAAQASAKK